MSQITPDSWIERSDYDQPPNPDDACMVCEKRDCVCPSDPNLGLQEAVEPNENTETGKPFTWPTIQQQIDYWKTHDEGGNILPDRIAANEEHYRENS
jgi:hypothetical protein